jgi:excisionase family DNA binding protein
MFIRMRKHIEVTDPQLNDRIAVTIDRAADILDLGRSSIYSLLREGRLKSIRIGNARRIPMQSIRELIAAAERQSA